MQISCEASAKLGIGHESAISKTLKGDESMKLLCVVFIGLTLVLGTFSAAYADCHKDGRAYPTGTVIDGFRCGANGRWERV
jgi:hypothetical protein